MYQKKLGGDRKRKPLGKLNRVRIHTCSCLFQGRLLESGSIHRNWRTVCSVLAHSWISQNIVVLLRPRIGEVEMKPEACEESLVLYAAGNGIPAPSALRVTVSFYWRYWFCSTEKKRGVLDRIVPAVLWASMWLIYSRREMRFLCYFGYETHNPCGLSSSFISVSNLCSSASCLGFAWLLGKCVKISRSFLDFFFRVNNGTPVPVHLALYVMEYTELAEILMPRGIVQPLR